MATRRVSSNHVSGFVKALTEDYKNKVLVFRVAKQKFVLQHNSSFATFVRVANLCQWNILILFRQPNKGPVKVIGIIERPLWQQVRAAADGQTYEEIKDLCPNGRPLNCPNFPVREA
jgi:hypothetical protein